MENNRELYHQYQEIKRFVSVDCVIFGYEQEQLKLLLFKRIIEPCVGEWSLIGGWLRENESAETAALRVLQYITGITDIYVEQVHVFSRPERDPGGTVLTIVFNALIRVEKHSKQLSEKYGAKWFPIDQVPPLIFDHDEMLTIAFEKLRFKATYDLIGRQLLPEKFTITQLRNLYSAIFQRQFDPGNFRKKVLSLKVLEQLEEKDMSESKKGAYYYRFKEVDESGAGEPIFRNPLKL